jgi:hypothetical protein
MIRSFKLLAFTFVLPAILNACSHKVTTAVVTSDTQQTITKDNKPKFIVVKEKVMRSDGTIIERDVMLPTE